MKRLLFCALLAATPRLTLAQPNPPVQPPAAPVVDEQLVKKNQEAWQKAQPQISFAQRLAFAADSGNRDGIALMGGFYSSLSRATSCREHMIMTQTTRENGKVTLTQKLDLEGVWRRKDRFSDKYLYHMKIDLQSVPAQGKASSLKCVEVDDGNAVRRYYLDRPEWSTVPADNSTPFSMVVAAPPLCWITTLMRVLAPPSFKVENKADGTTRVSSSNGFYDAVFSADGTLQSLTSTDETGSTAELRFEKLQVNSPVSNEELAWQAPAGAKEVPLEPASIPFNFNFFLEKDEMQAPTPTVATAPGETPNPTSLLGQIRKPQR